MYNHTKDVTWTSQHSVSPNSVFKRQALLVLLSRIAHILALKLVNLIIWGVSEHVITIIMDEEFIFLSLGERDSFSEFPVSFSIELVSLDEDAARLLRRLEQNKVSWRPLTLRNLDDLANFDIS